ncbi:MAG: sigma-E factor negative regulatory protein [Burkholderiaceae bacterium]|nr:sigma-E factor negative regulatory protein [Aquabacterium sp.]NUP85705.1 sigma-E factor negative regulatory protein [Burkholderiaceae bacterium]
MNMHESSDGDHAPGAKFSALMDGDLAGVDVDGACATWRADVQVRECWHTYHLIGDVLRSGELACDAGRAQAFLAGVRDRLAAEPVPLSPSALVRGDVPAAVGPTAVARRAGRSRTWAPMAAAAGVAAVAGVLVVMRTNAPQTSTAVAVQAAGPRAASGVIRDARLDRYLAAHRQVSNTTAVYVPGAAVRNVDSRAGGDR